MQKRILVVGGTGSVGAPVAHCLQAYGFRVRIMTRDAPKARALFDESFEVAVGNATDAGSVAEALAGCDGVHLNLPEHAEVAVAEAVAPVAGRLGLGRISCISGATVAQENCWFPMIAQKLRAEEAVRAAGIPYTILCPTWFMEGLPRFVVQGRAVVMGTQPCPYHWIAATDFAEMIAKAHAYAGTTSQRLIVHGPEAIPMQDALQRYCARCEPAITHITTMPLWAVKLLATLTRNEELKGAGALMAYFERMGEGVHPADVDTLLGTPTTTLDQWLDQRVAQRRTVQGADAAAPAPAASLAA